MPASTETLDALIVGTGFSGVFLLHHLRKLGYRVKALEGNSGVGGVWRSMTYPGARVDIEVPTYELHIEELLDDTDGVAPWVWRERFPGQEELQRYFEWIDVKLKLGKDCEFGTWVKSATWREEDAVWEVESRDGRAWRARYFLPCLGYAAKPLIPEVNGIQSFSGCVTHTATWPRDGLSVKDNKVGVIGTGATSLQVVQSIAYEVKRLVVFQRSPATAIPMHQEPFKAGDLTKTAKNEFYEGRKSEFDGSRGGMIPLSAKFDTPAQRDVQFRRLWGEGSLAFWTRNYMDLFTDAESNNIIYQWWRDRIHERVHDGKKAELLAPKEPPYAFGTKRVPLEQGYYEAFNFEHVDIVDVKTNPIKEVTSNGLTLESGTSFDLDVIILATGFDMSTGSFTNIDITGKHGVKLADKWIPQTKTYLGLSVSGFPNMLFPYGPQSPSNTCNGPVCAEIQGQWIMALLEYMKAAKKGVVEAEGESEAAYTELVAGLVKGSLFEETKSYYLADNLPSEGRTRQPVFWMGGLPEYREKLREVTETGYCGFEFSCTP